jgi:hypothetical protein
MNLSEAKTAVKVAGVPLWACSDTLATLGAEDLRKLAGQISGAELPGIFIHGPSLNPNAPRSDGKLYVRAEHLLCTLAKELVIANISVAVLSLYELAKHLPDQYTNLPPFGGKPLAEIQVVCLTDFYSVGIKTFMDEDTCCMVMGWMKRRVSNGLQICISSDLPLSDCYSYWPENFLDWLSKIVINYPVVK